VIVDPVKLFAFTPQSLPSMQIDALLTDLL